VAIQSLFLYFLLPFPFCLYRSRVSGALVARYSEAIQYFSLSHTLPYTSLIISRSSYSNYNVIHRFYPRTSPYKHVQRHIKDIAIL
jgi:hypothetical protein